LKVERETRHFDAVSRLTVGLRKKEFEEEYGYIFEPDLVKIKISEDWIENLQKQMPELPDERVRRLIKQYKIRKREAGIIVYVDKALADFFERCCKIYKNYKQLAKWVVGDLLKNLNWLNISIKESKVKPKTFVELLKLIDRKEITERLAKEIIKEYVRTSKSPKSIVKKKRLKIIKERERLIKIIKMVLRKEKKVVEDYKAGKKKVLEYIIGEVLKKSKIMADPKVVRKLLKEMV
jgi:aspartyl-tRNA(Asn)/glutamyl-tRNA(Gln) amidotransferase subunit B